MPQQFCQQLNLQAAKVAVLFVLQTCLYPDKEHARVLSAIRGRDIICY